jgi:hypothetical protein
MDLRNILPRLEHIMYFGLKDSVMQDNLPWSKEGKQSFIQHFVIKGMIDQAQEIAQLTAENERLQRVVEQFTWKPISDYVKPEPAGVCPAFIGQTADGQVIECYWSHLNQEFGSYGGPAEPVYFMEYPKAQLKGAEL